MNIYIDFEEGPCHNVVNEYGIYLLLGVLAFNIIDYMYIHIILYPFTIDCF